MMRYRVSYRQSAAQPWQDKAFADRASAVAFQRAMRSKLYAAFIQEYFPALGRWVG